MNHSNLTSDLKTNKLETQNLSHDYHTQYLDQLYRHYNVQVNHAILFYVPDNMTPIIFADKDKITVGRQDAQGRITPEFDLDSYNGAQMGVSRLHAKIVFEAGRFYIEDLHSTNHTWIDGYKLVPYQYYDIPNGALLQFGQFVATAYTVVR